MDRTHSIMRIATTASPVSGADVRERMEELRLMLKVERSVQLIARTWKKWKLMNGAAIQISHSSPNLADEDPKLALKDRATIKRCNTNPIFVDQPQVRDYNLHRDIDSVSLRKLRTELKDHDITRKKRYEVNSDVGDFLRQSLVSLVSVDADNLLDMSIQGGDEWEMQPKEEHEQHDCNTGVPAHKVGHHEKSETVGPLEQPLEEENKESNMLQEQEEHRDTKGFPSQKVEQHDKDDLVGPLAQPLEKTGAEDIIEDEKKDSDMPLRV